MSLLPHRCIRSNTIRSLSSDGGADWTDRLLPTSGDYCGPNSGVIWRNDDSWAPYVTGVAHANDCGRVISQSWELGGYGGPGTNPLWEALFDQYLNFLTN